MPPRPRSGRSSTWSAAAERAPTRRPAEILAIDPRTAAGCAASGGCPGRCPTPPWSPPAPISWSRRAQRRGHAGRRLHAGSLTTNGPSRPQRPRVRPGRADRRRERVLGPPGRAYLTGLLRGSRDPGRLDAVALPGSAEEVARVVAYCYDHDVAGRPPRRGSGLRPGAVPLDGGVVLGLERLRGLRAVRPPALAHLGRGRHDHGRAPAARARERPDASRPTRARPSSRRSAATSPPTPAARTPSSTGRPGPGSPGSRSCSRPGELVSLRRTDPPRRRGLRPQEPARRLRGDARGDHRRLAAPDPGARGGASPSPPSTRASRAGCAAVEAVIGSGVAGGGARVPRPAGRSRWPPPGSPWPRGPDGRVHGHRRGRRRRAPRPRASAASSSRSSATGPWPRRPRPSPAEIADLWRWRSGVSLAVRARRGAKISEDIIVPVERLAEAVEETIAIGARHGLEACSWGHAGDGNLHATFLVARDDPDDLARAELAVAEVFALAARLDGSISGEHGIGWVKRGQLARVWPPRGRSPSTSASRRLRPARADEPRQEARPRRLPAATPS